MYCIFTMDACIHSLANNAKELSFAFLTNISVFPVTISSFSALITIKSSFVGVKVYFTYTIFICFWFFHLHQHRTRLLSHLVLVYVIQHLSFLFVFALVYQLQEVTWPKLQFPIHWQHQSFRTHLYLHHAFHIHHIHHLARYTE